MRLPQIIVIVQPTSSGSGFDFTTVLPLVGVLTGGLISAFTSYFLNNRSNKQQRMRDVEEYKQQHLRDQIEYERQTEREQIAFDTQIKRERAAYVRSLKDAKRERLLSAYKVILKAADKFQYEMQQLNHASIYGNIPTIEVDEAVIEITLEDVGTDVMNIFFELRGAFNDYSVNLSIHTSSREEISKNRDTVLYKVKELTIAMQKHLKELES